MSLDGLIVSQRARSQRKILLVVVEVFVWVDVVAHSPGIRHDSCEGGDREWSEADRVLRRESVGEAVEGADGLRSALCVSL